MTNPVNPQPRSTAFDAYKVGTLCPLTGDFIASKAAREEMHRARLERQARRVAENTARDLLYRVRSRDFEELTERAFREVIHAWMDEARQKIMGDYPDAPLHFIEQVLSEQLARERMPKVIPMTSPGDMPETFKRFSVSIPSTHFTFEVHPYG